jgi:NAD(P)-dependent dehydrogenase (short-subunit alcohol dehydrogenase family)
VVYIPYVMPGFRLARLCAQIFAKEATPRTIGLVLEHHGLFTWGGTAKAAYELMIKLVTMAEEYLAGKDAWETKHEDTKRTKMHEGENENEYEKENEKEKEKRDLRVEIAALRKEISAAMGAPAILHVTGDPAGLAFSRRADVEAISEEGPATPDHVIRTKRTPMVGRDVAGFRAGYEAYFKTCAAKSPQKLTMLDSAPRVVLDRELGLCTVGRSAKEAGIAADIYRHTIEIILRAEALGGWQALPPADIFEVEYWDLEQAKLRAAGKTPVFAGEVSLVTGAASGIGKACVESLLKRGAAVVGLDINPAIVGMHKRPDFHGIVCDVSQEAAIAAALEEGVRRFGGLDMLVLNAGMFPPGAGIAEMKPEMWRKVMSLNLDANFFLMRECHPLLKLAPNGGRVAIIGSKNVPAPGPGAAAYSASKAAVNQLARVAALEWGKDRIRINSLHPNMVFDTALWTPEVLASRAKHYGLSVEQYKTNNVLQIEVTSRDVAELAAEMCGPLFAKTTASQVPVDGGNDRVI